MKKYSKLLVLLLSLALVIGALVIVSSAEENVGMVAETGGTAYATVKEAILAAEDGATVKIVANAAVTDMIEITKNVTIDLYGHTMNVTAPVAFAINANVKFEIVGDGVINVADVFIDNIDTVAMPEVSIFGTKSDIVINHNGSGSFISVNKGTYTFKNLKITSCTTGSIDTFSTIKGSDAVLNFIATSVSCSTQNGGLNGLIAIRGTSFATATNSSFKCSGLLINLADNLVGTSGYRSGDIFIANNSYFGSYNSSVKTGLVGSYCSYNGTLTFKDSVIDSSYRIFCLSATEENTEEKIILDNTVVRHNGLTKEDRMIARTAHLILKNGSSIVTPLALNELVYDTAYNIEIGEGCRVSHKEYTVMSRRESSSQTVLLPRTPLPISLFTIPSQTPMLLTFALR